MKHLTARHQKMLVVISLGITAGYCAYLGFPTVFTGSAAYDDEGYLLASLRSYVSSGGLYSKTYSQYGPGYYSVFGTLFRILRVDLLSLTPGRLITLVLVVAGSLAGAVAVWLATKRLLVAIAAQLVLCAFLLGAVAEPLHPGTYLGFLLALVALVCFLPRRKWPLVAPAALGMVLALMLTTKINVGGFALAGCVLAVGSAHASRRIRTAACLVLLALPFVLMTGGGLHLRSAHKAFPVVVALGAAVAHLVIADGPRGSATLDRRSVWAFVGSMVGVTILACVPVIVTGTSPASLLKGAIIDPTRQPNIFTVLYPIDQKLTVILLLPALVLVGAALVARRVLDEPGTSWVVGGLKLVGGFLVVARLLSSPTDALSQLVVLTALCAVPLRRYSNDGLLARRVLVVIAVLQPLQAYPVAGGQKVWGSLLIGLVAFINIGDGLSEMVHIVEAVGETARGLPRMATGLAVLLIVGIIVGGSVQPWSAYQLYDKLPSLDLPGAELVHVDAAQVAVYTSVVGLLRSNCDSFYGLPGVNSFHVFAQMPSVTGRDGGAWFRMFDDETQKAAVQDLRAFPGRLCVIRNDVVLAFWLQKTRLREGPLVQFVEQFSQEVGRAGDYVVLRRPTSESG